MPDFDRIKSEMEDLRLHITMAEEEMLFVQNTFHSLDLKVKPIWAIGIVISLFIMEVVKAINKQVVNISIWSWIVFGLTVVGYLIYFIIESVNNYKYNKERKDLFITKRSIYENLNAQRRSFFEEFVNETMGEKLVEANINLIRYIWKEEDIVTLATLKENLIVENFDISEILYIANDELLSDYNKRLGLSAELESSTPYCYLFTKDKCYVFLSEYYSVLRKLFPDKEIDRAIIPETFEEDSEVI